MDLFKEAEKIDAPKSREYFSEVLRCYANENYRSAIVMLYTVCLCDLVYKLQELKDMYNDSQAEQILKKLELERKKSNSLSSWEKTLVDDIAEKTKILDLEGKTALMHLFDWRNMCAHPAMNSDYELFRPTQEQVAASIRACLDNILLKPAVFIKEIALFMAEDFKKQKEALSIDENVFKSYVEKKYLAKMSMAMLQKTFKTFWKFTMIVRDEDCDECRTLNAKLLGYMYDLYPREITDAIERDKNYYIIVNDSEILTKAVVFFAHYPKLYSLLDDETKMMISTFIGQNDSLRLISWFLSIDKKAHLIEIQNMGRILGNDAKYVPFFYNTYKKEGLEEMCLDYFIGLISVSAFFVTEDLCMNSYILPYASRYTIPQWKRIIRNMDSNDQCYSNRNFAGWVSMIWANAKLYVSHEELKDMVHFKRLLRTE